MKQIKSKAKNMEEKEKKSSDFECSGMSENESSYMNSECIKKEKKQKLKLKKQRIYKKKCHGLWTNEEQALFIEYMKQFQNIFMDKQLRRSQRIFKKMSKFLKTRSPDQCRSHHQKYEIRFGHFDGIVNYLQSKLEQEGYQHPNHNVKIQETSNTQKKQMDQQLCIYPHSNPSSIIQQKKISPVKKSFKKYQRKQTKNSHQPFIQLNGQLLQEHQKLNQEQNNKIADEQLDQIANPLDYWRALGEHMRNKSDENFIDREKMNKEIEKGIFATSGGVLSQTRQQIQSKLIQQGFNIKVKQQRGLDIFEHKDKAEFVFLLSFEEFFDEY